MFTATSARRWAMVPATLVLAVAAVGSAVPAQAASPSGQAGPSVFFEETASAFWEVPHSCAARSTVQATLLVQSTRDFESPDRDDPDPTVRVQYLAVCPDSTSFTWGNGAMPATIDSQPKLKSVHTTGSGVARDIFGVSHTVSVDVTWTGVGKIETEVNGPGSKRDQRTATAVGTVIFDGVAIVNGPSNHPTRPAPFIRVDIER